MLGSVMNEMNIWLYTVLQNLQVKFLNEIPSIDQSILAFYTDITYSDC